MELLMDDMVSTALLHVIDAKTSYNMLLRHPWLHENFVVPSTWHQYFKYCRNGTVKKVLGDSKPFTEAESHFADAKYYIDDAKKGKEISMKQPSKPPLKGLCPQPKKKKENTNLGKLSPEAAGKKLYGLNANQVMLKEKGHAIQESRVGLGFTPPKLIRIGIKRASSNYVVEEFSSTEDDKRKESPRESVFNRLGPHRRTVHGTSSEQSVFDRLGPYKKIVYPKKCMFKVAARTKKNVKFLHTQKLRSLIPSRMRRQITLAISCGKVLKVKAQTMIFTQVQSNDEDDRESVASSNYINNSDSSHGESYVVKEAYTNGAYKLIAEDGLRIGKINRKFLKWYYA
ncbi:UNVERIFIED_CONTAM: hypothetical protein Slati_3690400 [Sesamum latifolium]|uniref:Uncharacterized protein n=1 Tax=Sesamum latifolium TaxID=2727402 RepID=A0AAW2U358_9LAMI